MRARASIIAIAIVAGGLAPAPAAGIESTDRAARGVTKDRLKIGLHMPFTGAAPIPSESARQGSDVYWRWLRQRGVKINGRYVRAIVKNDNYNPSQAVAVCKELVEKERVFLLAGTMQPGGGDQVQACARYAASVGVPYISLGSTERAVDRLPRYFAISNTWRRQAKMLADHLVSDLGARSERNGMLWHDTPNNQETHNAFARSIERKKARLHYDRRVSRNSTQTEAQTVVAEMKAANIENVFVLSSPVWFLQVLQSARSQNYRPLWVGIDGIPNSGDTLANVGCRNGTIARSRFLSALPAFSDRDSFDRRHDRGMKRVYGDEGDSMTWLGWAGSAAIRKLLERAGRDLTGARFERRTERARNVRTGILPRFSFRPKDHFGGRGTHVLKVDCAKEEWTTLRRFVGNF